MSLIPMFAVLGSAHAAPVELHSCLASAEGPNGNRFEVQGHGSSEADARRAARQSARLLADQRLLVEVAQAWLAEGGSERLAQWILPTGTGSFAAPGWAYTPGACTVSTVEGDGGWSARWTSTSENVVRAHPADALEAARRRACLTQYQVAFLQTLKSRSDGGAEVPLTPLDTAWGSLAQCWSQPAPAPAPAPLADTAGPTRCAALGADADTRALGFGPSAERAAEDALRQVVIAESRRVVGDVATAMVVAAPDERQALVSSRMARLAALTGPSDAVDRARLACSAVTPGPVVWKPTGRLEKDCNPASWMERPKGSIAPDGVGTFLDETCALQVDSTMTIVRFSLKGADGPKRDELVASGFRVAGTCEADCFAHATWGTAPKPVTLANAPDRTDKKKVVAELTTAMKGDALRGLQLLPTLQDPSALGRLFDGSLWGALEPQLKTLPTATDRWKQVEGHWILLPPG